ncbi:hypothetical protein LOC67_19065 [Stieleria sp. JC731]|nr:hypothetical protein [Stieleria sp. JC731]
MLYLIYRPEQNTELLALVDEAICLLPEPKRWNATFSTHACELPPGVQCRLRCLIAGSPEALSLPPTALQLDLSSGNLEAPPDGPLVEAARSGRLSSVAPARPVLAPGVSRFGQTSPQEPTNEATNRQSADPKSPGPPPQPIPGQAPPPFQPQYSQNENNRLTLLAIAALAPLILGVVASIFLLRSDSEALLTELNAEAGIKAPPKENIPKKVLPEPDIEQQPEPNEPASGIDADPDINEKRDTEEKQRHAIEELAETIIKGAASFNDPENPVTKLSREIHKNLELLEEQNKQLSNLTLLPSDEKLSSWVRLADSKNQVTQFIADQEKLLSALATHANTEDLKSQQARLNQKYETWNTEATRWEQKRTKQPELAKSANSSYKVERNIDTVRSKTTERFKSITDSLQQHEELATLNSELASSNRKKLSSLRANLEAELQRRRDSHSLDIYFDGDSRRRENRLHIEPLCKIALGPSDARTIDHLKVNDSRPIRLPQLNHEINLPGEFEGWLTISSTETGITLRLNLNQNNIPNDVRQEYPILKQLELFIQQQDLTFNSAERLSKAFAANRRKAEEEIAKKLEEANQSNASAVEKANLQEQKQDIEKLAKVIKQAPANKLNQLYIVQTNQAAVDLKRLQPSISKIFKDPEIEIEKKLDEHIMNLRDLKEKYHALTINNGLIDFNAQIEFGKVTPGVDYGQSSFETIESFDMFFFPELFYGPPPKD